jgi:hypothetical protein
MIQEQGTENASWETIPARVLFVLRVGLSESVFAQIVLPVVVGVRHSWDFGDSVGFFRSSRTSMSGSVGRGTGIVADA